MLGSLVGSGISLREKRIRRRWGTVAEHSTQALADGREEGFGEK